MELLNSFFTGYGAVLVAVLMAATVMFKWPSWLHYIWALLVLVSGLLTV